MEKKFDNNLQMSVWERETKNGDTFLSGTVEIDGVVYDVALFKNNSENPKAPKYKGKLKEKQ